MIETTQGTILVELFGVARLRARTGRVYVNAATVGEALARLVEACPALDGTVIFDGAPHPAYRLNLNGARFVNDPQTRLGAGDSLLILAADVGG